ncbi:MAG: hypothetical protein ACP5SH_20690, partial [Syntrophobacteraceae bacterium]
MKQLSGSGSVKQAGVPHLLSYALKATRQQMECFVPTLGIITCQSLELEFAHLLSNDPEIAVVRVLENPFAPGFCEAMERMGGKDVERIRYLTLGRPKRISSYDRFLLPG